MAGQTQLSPAVAYVRVSRVAGRSGESFISPDVQRERCEQLARERGLRIIETYTDLDESGGEWHRPAFQEALAAVTEDRRAVALIGATQDRVSRSTRDLLRVADEVDEAGGALVVGDLPDASGPGGKLLRTMLAAVAEGELDRHRDRWNTAKARAVDRGVAIKRCAPIGYDFTPEHRLTPNGDAEAVRAAFRLAGAGGSLRAVRDLIENATGIRRALPTTREMLRNETYLGVVRYGTLANMEAHEPLVTRDEFDAAQREPTTRRASAKSLLAGIATCASCGRGMVASTSGTSRMYRCPVDSGKRPKCEAPATILLPVLDEFVTEAVRSWARGEGLEDQVIETRERADSSIEELTRALAIEEDRRDAYAVETATLDVPASTIAKGLAAREERVQAAREALEAARERDGVTVSRQTIGELWEDSSTAERRCLIASVVSRVEIRRLTRRNVPEPVEARSLIVWK